MRVLVVEDEKKVAKALRERLEAEHYDVRVASSGEEGVFLVNHEAFDCVVLPQRDGLEVLTTLRKRGLPTPVLILTAKDTIDDRVRGLDSGADDYLVKPFAIPELPARIRALLRRGRPDQILKLHLDDLQMDLATRTVTRGGQTLELTVKEFEVCIGGSGERGPGGGTAENRQPGPLSPLRTSTHYARGGDGTPWVTTTGRNAKEYAWPLCVATAVASSSRDKCGFRVPS